MKPRIPFMEIGLNRLIKTCLMGLFIAANSMNIWAETTDKDMKIAMRAIKFLSEGPKGNVKAAIVYNPADSASQQDANTIKAFISKNPKAGAATLNPTLVDVSALSEIQGSAVVLLTTNIAANHAAIFAETIKVGAVSISTDKSCVKNGHCVLGISSSPKVEIFVNKAAALETETNFKTAFMMLVNVL